MDSDSAIGAASLEDFCTFGAAGASGVVGAVGVVGVVPSVLLGLSVALPVTVGVDVEDVSAAGASFPVAAWTSTIPVLSAIATAERLTKSVPNKRVLIFQPVCPLYKMKFFFAF